jgi:hypothetical protein
MQCSTKSNWFWTIKTPDQRDTDQIGIVLERTTLSGSDLLFLSSWTRLVLQDRPGPGSPVQSASYPEMPHSRRKRKGGVTNRFETVNRGSLSSTLTTVQF